MFGKRNRGRLSAQDEVKVLEVVKARLKETGKPFLGIREEIAAALTANKFDDNGVGCEQEVKLTAVVAVTCGCATQDVQENFKAKSLADREKVLDEAIAYVR